MTLPLWAVTYNNHMSDKKILITIGRQFGSGGKSVALAIGGRLNVPVYDNELLSKAAEESGFSKSIFERKDEKHNIFSLTNFSSAAQAFGSPRTYIDDASIHHIQAMVIKSIAESGSAIFVGRASDYVLRDMETLDVFITADMEDRVRRVSGRMGIKPEQARSLIPKRDRERASFYNYLTLTNWGVAETYDLCVNSSLLGIDGTADFIIDFARRRGIVE